MQVFTLLPILKPIAPSNILSVEIDGRKDAWFIPFMKKVLLGTFSILSMNI